MFLIRALVNVVFNNTKQWAETQTSSREADLHWAVCKNQFESLSTKLISISFTISYTVENMLAVISPEAMKVQPNISCFLSVYSSKNLESLEMVIELHDGWGQLQFSKSVSQSFPVMKREICRELPKCLHSQVSGKN